MGERGVALIQQLLRRKPVRQPADETGADVGELSRSIGLVQLSMLGIGATVGTGIFFVLSQAVPVAGPAAIISFVVAGVVAGLTAMCYAELAGAMPVSGSSYSYAYATLGELPAVAVGACLLLEYGVSAAAVAVGWSEYLNALLHNVFGFRLPDAVSQSPEEGGVVNLPAVALVALCGLLLVRGVSESARVNATMVAIKLAILVVFGVVGMTGWHSDHFADFAPFGVGGIMSAAGIVFFSYIGLDAISTAGEEVKNPHRNMPLAIFIALCSVTGIYLVVVVVAIGAQSPSDFREQKAGLAAILERVTGATWPGTLLAVGAVASIFSVTLVVIYGQTRILFAMSRDGMLPEVFHQVNSGTLSPAHNTVIACVVIAMLAGLIPINFLAEMTSIGTLVAFLVVSIGVIVLRRTAPDLPRTFKLPGYPITPVLSVIGCIWIIKDLRRATIYVFLLWVTVALLWYFAYGVRHSRLNRTGKVTESGPELNPAGF
ncbi:amino acid permease [Nocardia sp. NPDC051052]|uniref:amino acid permease n=1 Tax=Nocardia sp. NPDC051052 TaxID=3364322 RepID=UPI003788FCC8